MIKDKNNRKRFKQFGNSGSKYRIWRNRVIMGFGNKCFFTGARTSLTIHHIDGNCQNNSVYNLVCVHQNLHKLFDKLSGQQFWEALRETTAPKNSNLKEILGSLQVRCVDYAQI